MSHHQHRLSDLAALRERRRSHRAARRERLALRRDLAEFRTPSDLADLSALLRRYDDRVADPIRHIVDWSRAA